MWCSQAQGGYGRPEEAVTEAAASWMRNQRRAMATDSPDVPIYALQARLERTLLEIAEAVVAELASAGGPFLPIATRVPVRRLPTYILAVS